MNKTQAVGNYTGATAPVGGLLGVAFVVLKLTNVIHRSWWLVLLPFYGPAAAVVGLCLVLLVIAGLFLGLSKILEAIA